MDKFKIKQLENFVLQPENLESIKDAIEQTFFKEENFNDFITLVKVKDGDPIATIGQMDMVGEQGSGCDPTYEEVGIANTLERWKLGDWQVPLKICYESLKGTVGEYCLKTGTNIGDLSDTDFMAIYINALDRAMKQMVWRKGWFGDTQADNTGTGGKLTTGIDKKFFTTCDGLFKRIFEATASKNRTTIAANNEDTMAAQISKIREKGVATDLVDNMLMDVDSRIVDDPDAVLLMTRSLADALTFDIKKTYHDIMPWEKIFEGFETSVYNGVKIAKVSIWDHMIHSYEKGGTAYNLPHRMVYCNPKHLMVGTPQDSLVSELDMWFDHKERRNYLYSTGKMGTALLEPNMIWAAY